VPPTPPTREVKSASGTIKKEDGVFFLTGDADFKNGMKVKNSANVHLSPILDLYVENKKIVALEGIVESSYPNEMIVLSVAGKQILTEANAMDTSPRPEDTSTEAFSVFYAALSKEEQACLTAAFGQTQIKKWIANPALKPSADDLRRINACVE